MNFDKIIDRRLSESIKWQRYPADVLPLWVADMDFAAPQAVQDALHARVTHGVLGYGSDSAPLREILVDRMLKLYDWVINPEDIVFLPGVVTGFHLVCAAFCNAQKGYAIQTPVYPPFFHVQSNLNLPCRESALVNHDLHYATNYDDLALKTAADAAVFILCNPHNPVGRVFTRQELEKMAEICLKNKVLICSDEIHADIIFDQRVHIPIASLDREIADQTITLMAPSKTFNIAGLDTSIAIATNPELRQTLEQHRGGLVGYPNILGMAAAEAAYRDGQPWLDALLPYLQANRDFLVDYLHQHMPEIGITPPEGTFLAWLDCRQLHLPASPYQFFLEKAKVALNDGEGFGKDGAGFVRLNFGCPRATLHEALQRMKTALEGLHSHA